MQAAKHVRHRRLLFSMALRTSLGQMRFDSTRADCRSSVGEGIGDPSRGAVWFRSNLKGAIWLV
jgi:hypothetical protein